MPNMWSMFSMYTANSMNCLTEALWYGTFRGNGTIPAVYSERIKSQSTQAWLLWIWYTGITARDIITKDSIGECFTVDMALGCSY